MNLRSLEVFLAVVEKGGFAAAGQKIGLTQSAVSIQIKALEESLNTILFDRSKRPPVLNKNGLLLVKKSRHLLEQVDKIQHSFTETKYSGILQTGTVTSVLTGVLPSALHKLKKIHPRLWVTVTTNVSVELISQVNNGILDCAIVSEPITSSPGLVWHSFASEPLVIVSPPGTDGISEQELLSYYPFLQFAKNTRIGKIIENEISSRGIKLLSKMELDSLEAINLLVGKGLGVSIVPQRSHSLGLKKELTVSPFGKKTIMRELGLVFRENHPNAKLISTLGMVLVKETNQALKGRLK